MSEFDNYKLVYFDARGIMEATRIMFSLAGQKYEDFRFPLSSDMKRPEFDVANAAGELKINMNRAPILIYNNAVFYLFSLLLIILFMYFS